jgi:transposase
MKISNYTFSEKEIEYLEIYRDNQKNSRLKMRFIVLLMIAQGILPELTASIIGINLRTISNWFQQYITEGIESLNSFNYKSKQPKLNINQIHQVIIWVTYNHPENTKEIREYIEVKFGVAYCDESVRLLLKKYGLKFMKPKVIPGNPPSVEVQKNFIREYETKRAEPNSVVLFGDAVHFMHQNIPGLCWCDPLFPLISETNSGRKRLNCLGAYDPETCSFIHLTGEENCNAERVIEFLEKIIRAYTGTASVSLIVDNARYFHARKVSEWLENHPQIKPDFLPAYAPNLNLIERFWKFAKKELVKNKYYKEYKKFRANVFRFLNHTDEYIDDFKSLMVEKFEIIYA